MTNPKITSILLDKTVFDQEIFEPEVSVFELVEKLLNSGVPKARISRDLLAVNASNKFWASLDYSTQPFFPGYYDELSSTAFAELDLVREHCATIGLHDIAETISQIAAWFRAHAEKADSNERRLDSDAADRQTSAFIKKLYRQNHIEGSADAYLKRLPPEQAAAIGRKILIPSNGPERIEAFVDAAMKNYPNLPMEEAVELALPSMQDLIEARSHVAKEYVLRGISRHYKPWADMDNDAIRQAMSENAERILLRPAIGERDRYLIHTWVWLKHHPDVTQFPSPEVQSVVDNWIETYGATE